MIVLDNSALINAIVAPGEAGRAVLGRIAEEQVAAPELIDIEAVATIRGLVLGRRLSLRAADRTIAVLSSLSIQHVPHAPLVPRMWELRDNLTAYDAAYVAVAELLSAPLVTGDARIAAAPGLRCSVEVVV